MLIYYLSLRNDSNPEIVRTLWTAVTTALLGFSSWVLLISVQESVRSDALKSMGVPWQDSTVASAGGVVRP